VTFGNKKEIPIVASEDKQNVSVLVDKYGGQCERENITNTVKWFVVKAMGKQQYAETRAGKQLGEQCGGNWEFID
jgi:hypothetical protein